MSYIPRQQENTGSFVETTNIWGDIARVQEVSVDSPEFKELLVRLYHNINNIALTLNKKDTGYYLNQEFNTGQQFFNADSDDQLLLRPVIRKIINFGALPNSTSKSVNHGISIPSNSILLYTRLYGAATNASNNNGLAIPNNDIRLAISSTQVTVTTSANLSAYDNTYIIVEFVRKSTL